MSDNREWNSFEGDDADEPQFRQFPDQQKHTPAGDKGLWSILDSVARQPSRPEHPLRAEPAPVEPVADPSPPIPAYVPPPSPAATSAFLQSDNSGSTREFGHLFRRQREESPAAPEKSTSLKSLFKRISR